MIHFWHGSESLIWSLAPIRGANLHGLFQAKNCRTWWLEEGTLYHVLRSIDANKCPEFEAFTVAASGVAQLFYCRVPLVSKRLLSLTMLFEQGSFVKGRG